MSSDDDFSASYSRSSNSTYYDDSSYSSDYSYYSQYSSHDPYSSTDTYSSSDAAAATIRREAALQSDFQSNNETSASASSGNVSGSSTTDSNSIPAFSTGAKAGIAIGIVVLLAGLMILLVLYVRRHRRQRPRGETHDVVNQNDDLEYLTVHPQPQPQPQPPAAMQDLLSPAWTNGTTTRTSSIRSSSRQSLWSSPKNKRAPNLETGQRHDGGNTGQVQMQEFSNSSAFRHPFMDASVTSPATESQATHKVNNLDFKPNWTQKSKRDLNKQAAMLNHGSHEVDSRFVEKLSFKDGKTKELGIRNTMQDFEDESGGRKLF